MTKGSNQPTKNYTNNYRLGHRTDIMTYLEGNTKVPVDHKLLVDRLQRGKFRKNEAENCIKMMLRKAKIYESKPNCYNTT